MADMQVGIGPFLGVFLLAKGWYSGPIGTVTTIGSVAGILMTAPAGAVIDATTHKRRYVILSQIATAIAGSSDNKASGMQVLFSCRSLLILATVLACFHLDNGALCQLGFG
ncbi:hypothetical protein KTO58_14180 [Chitinophaga pendula]|uniref:hypothetical protein n=1 Tax=Chitinophaga TaxID=79328 RepID=UPI0018DFDF03|nr:MULTISPECIES: hypothetical protein [Chitinophaga]UCJ04852.1 hypothetical protein KTO58_14180 [Chitinophaga pendula]